MKIVHTNTAVVNSDIIFLISVFMETFFILSDLYVNIISKESMKNIIFWWHKLFKIRSIGTLDQETEKNWKHQFLEIKKRKNALLIMTLGRSRIPQK